VVKSAPLTTGFKVKVTNLDKGVTASDMKELFAMVGKTKKDPVVKNKQCIAVFAKRSDAMNAIKKYNGQQTHFTYVIAVAIMSCGVCAGLSIRTTAVDIGPRVVHLLNRLHAL
jgi:hypothetical protein